MFGAPSRYAAPGARYRDIDVAARVEGATPHGLIMIMFDETLKGIDVLRAAEGAHDYKRGGEIAANLGRIYREARRLLGPTPGMDRATALAQARDMLATVSGAWEAIGPEVNANLT
jgi:flagellar protein FliS